MNAVVESEHVSRLVRKDLQAAPQEPGSPGLAVALKAVDTDAVPQGSLAEDKVPAVGRVEINHRDGNSRVGIFRHVLLEPGEHLRREQLLIPSDRILSRGDTESLYRHRILNRHVRVEKNPGILGHLFEHVRCLRLEFPYRLEIERRARLLEAISLRPEKLIEALSGLPVIRQPIGGIGYSFPLKEVTLRESPSLLRREIFRRSDRRLPRLRRRRFEFSFGSPEQEQPSIQDEQENDRQHENVEAESDRSHSGILPVSSVKDQPMPEKPP